MTKYVYIAVLLVGFLTSCTFQKGMECPAVKYMAQIDTIQTDSTLFVVVE